MVERRIFALGLTSFFLSKVILSLFSHRPLRVRERNKTGFPCFAPLAGALAALSFSTSRAILDVSFHHLRAATSRSIVVADLFRHDVLFLSLFFFFPREVGKGMGRGSKEEQSKDERRKSSYDLFVLNLSQLRFFRGDFLAG